VQANRRERNRVHKRPWGAAGLWQVLFIMMPWEHSHIFHARLFRTTLVCACVCACVRRIVLHLLSISASVRGPLPAPRSPRSPVVQPFATLSALHIPHHTGHTLIQFPLVDPQRWTDCPAQTSLEARHVAPPKQARGWDRTLRTCPSAADNWRSAPGRLKHQAQAQSGSESCPSRAFPPWVAGGRTPGASTSTARCGGGRRYPDRFAGRRWRLDWPGSWCCAGRERRRSGCQGVREDEKGRLPGRVCSCWLCPLELNSCPTVVPLPVSRRPTAGCRFAAAGGRADVNARHRAAARRSTRSEGSAAHAAQTKAGEIFLRLLLGWACWGRGPSTDAF
jgi:hypothetical protein